MTESNMAKSNMAKPSEHDIATACDGWLQRQRWFAGKGREAALSAAVLGVLAGESASVTIYAVTARYADSTVQTYQVPVTVYSSSVAGLDHALIDVVSSDGEPLWVYDALADKDATHLWLLGLIWPGLGKQVSFECVDTAEVPIGATAIPLNAEQSNTSVVFGQSIILKVFRQLHTGINPDVEITRALTAVHTDGIASFLGAASADLDGLKTTLAMMQEYVPATTSGWELALTSVRDLLAGDNLPIDSPAGGEAFTNSPAARAGGDFAGEAERLGAAVATIHRHMASALGTRTTDPAWLEAVALRMHARFDIALHALPSLATFEGAIRSSYDAVAALSNTASSNTASSNTAKPPLLTQRIHGDLHLGQVLRSPERWIVLDFEGEPSAPIVQRSAHDSVLRDVAGMLRSFDYAPQHHLALDSTRSTQPSQESQSDRAAQWTQRNSEAFCVGYGSVAGYDPRQEQVLLLGYQIDKAVYEAVYESRNRPDWLTIPMNALHRLVGA